MPPSPSTPATPPRPATARDPAAPARTSAAPSPAAPPRLVAAPGTAAPLRASTPPNPAAPSRSAAAPGPAAPVRASAPPDSAAPGPEIAPPGSFLAWTFRLAKIAIVAGALVAAVSARVVVAGEREIALSTAALRAGDPHDAALHARRAAGLYAPGAPHVRVAYDRLLALATKAETRGDRPLALYAWQAIRTAALETRWLVTPHASDLDRANAAIARLQSTADRPPAARTEPATTLERAQLDALSRTEAPHTPWVAALVAAFLAWTAGAYFVVRRGVTTTGTFVWPRVRTPLAVTAAGIALWLLAIWQA